MCWHAKPTAAEQRVGPSCAGFAIHQASNPIGHGIAAAAARIARGRLRIVAGTSPLAEVGLYRDPEGGSGGGESPLPQHNHALDAQRGRKVLWAQGGSTHSIRRRAAPGCQGGAAVPETTDTA